MIAGGRSGSAHLACPDAASPIQPLPDQHDAKPLSRPSHEVAVVVGAGPRGARRSGHPSSVTLQGGTGVHSAFHDHLCGEVCRCFLGRQEWGLGENLEPGR